MAQYDHQALTGKFESYLSAHQPYGSPDSLYEPIRYINEIGGKRIRPVLLLMAYNLWHEDITPALPAALAVEYFHNFSLMHDDIMDEAPLRRGKKTVHKLFHLNNAILSGDALLIRCFDLLLEAGKPADKGAELCSVMTKASLEICEGQQMDMDFEKLDSPTEEEYLEMIRRKTASLIGTSLKLGAVMAGASHVEAETLYQFGERIGMAFQVQDDYLDVFGDISRTGKQAGGDILRGKKNFLYVHTCNTLSLPDQKNFKTAYTQAAIDQDPSQILDFYAGRNVGSYTQRIQASFFEKAMAELNSLKDIDPAPLRELGVNLMTRDH
jgi:geranylgeranyl diphosphate synthase type II